MTIIDESIETTIDRSPAHDEAADAFVERVFEAVLGAQEVHAIAMGHRLGWYDDLAANGPATPVELAERTGTDARYAQEWLEHQASCGYLVVDDVTAAPTERRFTLPAAHAEVLTDADSLRFVAPLARLVAGVGEHLSTLVDAYRTGDGVSWDELGHEVRLAQSDANRPLFLHELGQVLLPQIEDLDARLRAGGRVADVGFGGGWSSIGIALAYPEVTVDGYDIDAPSVELARRHAAAAGVDDRVSFHCVDAGAVALDQTYDAVFAFECIHDMAHPVSVLSSMKRLAGDDGIVVVMDERVGDSFSAPGDEVERLMYGYSLTCCLPDGRSHEHSAATGTVMRHGTFEDYARAAGFSRADALPLENDFFRFYRLER